MLVKSAEAAATLSHALFDFMQQIMNRRVARAGDGDALPVLEQIADYLRSIRAFAAAWWALNEQIALLEGSYRPEYRFGIDDRRLYYVLVD